MGSTEACPALEVNSCTKLAIEANGTRIARGYEHLGLQAQPFFSNSMSGIIEDGGTVPAIDVVILSRYPTIIVERLNDGTTISRTEMEDSKAEHKWQESFQQAFQEAIEGMEKDPLFFENLDICGDQQSCCFQYAQVIHVDLV